MKRWSIRRIAELCDVDEKTVRSLRPEPTAENPQLKTVGRDGRARKAPTKKPKPASKPIAVRPDGSFKIDLGVHSPDQAAEAMRISVEKLAEEPGDRSAPTESAGETLRGTDWEVVPNAIGFCVRGRDDHAAPPPSLGVAHDAKPAIFEPTSRSDDGEPQEWDTWEELRAVKDAIVELAARWPADKLGILAAKLVDLGNELVANGSIV
jgi:hypothetical protein